MFLGIRFPRLTPRVIDITSLQGEKGSFNDVLQSTCKPSCRLRLLLQAIRSVKPQFFEGIEDIFQCFFAEISDLQ